MSGHVKTLEPTLKAIDYPKMIHVVPSLFSEGKLDYNEQTSTGNQHV